MQVMVIVKASPEDEKRTPNTEEFAAMGKFNDGLVEAGIMLSGEGLLPSATGKRVRFGGGKPVVVDGPFTESKELVAGFWVWKVKSMDEALSWAKRIPFHEGEVEVRQIATAEDFGAEFTPELKAQEDALRERLSKQ